MYFCIIEIYAVRIIIHDIKHINKNRRIMRFVIKIIKLLNKMNFLKAAVSNYIEQIRRNPV